MSISREQLLKLHSDVTAKAREVMTAKNHDYAHEGDVFRNFRYFGGLGILVRLSDKLARLRSFEENGTFKVEDEKLIDTVIDAINYAVIYLAYKQENAPNVEVKDGPYCDNCYELAVFRQDQGKVFPPIYWCADCAVRKNVSSDDLTAMAGI
jgi:hypothetical protein